MLRHQQGGGAADRGQCGEAAGDRLREQMQYEACTCLEKYPCDGRRRRTTSSRRSATALLRLAKLNNLRDLVLTARTFICALVVTGFVGKDAHQ